MFYGESQAIKDDDDDDDLLQGALDMVSGIWSVREIIRRYVQNGFTSKKAALHPKLRRYVQKVVMSKKRRYILHPKYCGVTSKNSSCQKKNGRYIQKVVITSKNEENFFSHERSLYNNKSTSKRQRTQGMTTS